MSATLTGEYTISALVLPNEISGLQQWLKADAIVGLNDNDPVGTWSDSSGNGVDVTQSTADNKPLYKTNQLNGLPSVRSDGSNDALANVSYSHTATSKTVFAVLRDNRVSGWNRDRLITFGMVRLWLDYDGAGVGYYDGSGGEGGGGGRNNNWHIYTFVLEDGVGGTVYRDGTSIFTDTFTASAITQIFMFSEGGVMPAQIDLCEIGFYDSALSTGDRNKLEQYLRTKYAF